MLDQIQRAYEEMRAYFSLPGARRAAPDEGGCQYLTRDGRKCAVGCRIPAEWMERIGADRVNDAGYLPDFVAEFPEMQAIVGRPDTLLYSFHEQAQVAHDVHSQSAAEFVQQLDGIAERFGLTLVTDNVPQAEPAFA